MNKKILIIKKTIFILNSVKKLINLRFYLFVCVKFTFNRGRLINGSKKRSILNPSSSGVILVKSGKYLRDWHSIGLKGSLSSIISSCFEVSAVLSLVFSVLSSLEVPSNFIVSSDWSSVVLSALKKKVVSLFLEIWGKIT